MEGFGPRDLGRGIWGDLGDLGVSSGRSPGHTAAKEFVKLIKEGKYEIIGNLLFSPNYFTSINAMESLQYLESKSLVQLSPESLARIELIKNSDFTIVKQMAPDAFYHVKGYKELNVTTDKAIRKYRVEVNN